MALILPQFHSPIAEDWAVAHTKQWLVKDVRGARTDGLASSMCMCGSILAAALAAAASTACSAFANAEDSRSTCWAEKWFQFIRSLTRMDFDLRCPRSMSATVKTLSSAAHTLADGVSQVAQL